MSWNASRMLSKWDTWCWEEEMRSFSKSCLRILAWATTGTRLSAVVGYGREKPRLGLTSLEYRGRLRTRLDAMTLGHLMPAWFNLSGVTPAILLCFVVRRW